MPAVKRIVVVGGVAGGMSAAARLRRLDEHASIVVLERGAGRVVRQLRPAVPRGRRDPGPSLAPAAHAAVAARLARPRRPHPPRGRVDRPCRPRRRRTRPRSPGTDELLPYDALVLATGAEPIVPPLPGLDRPQVRTLRNVPDADALRALLDAGARSAVVVGAGFIGLETVEAFRHRGLDVTLVELAPQVLPALDADMAVDDRGRARGPRRRRPHGRRPRRRRGLATGHAVDVVLSDGERIGADIVLLGVGVRPSTALAQGRRASSSRRRAPSSSRRRSGRATRTSGPSATRSR